MTQESSNKSFAVLGGSLELSEYQELLKKLPEYQIGQHVYCLPDDYPEDAPLMPCLVIGIELSNEPYRKGYYYTLIYFHEHEEQTDPGEWTKYSLIEEGIPEACIYPDPTI